MPITLAVLVLTLLGSRRAGQGERVASVPTDNQSAHEKPFHFHDDWAELDLDLMPREVELIQPESTLMRRYESPNGGESVELTVIAGRHKKSVHTPGYCLPGNGWEVVQQQSRRMSLPDGQIPVTQAVMGNDAGQRMLVTYYFTDGRFATNNIGVYQFKQLAKRFKRQSSLCAMVRVVVPVHTDLDAARALNDEFSTAAFPRVMNALREMEQR
jgi:EpsI family protein